MAGASPFVQPVALTVAIYLPIPSSWSKSKQEKARTGLVAATKKPDADNVLKALKDGMNGVVYVDARTPEGVKRYFFLHERSEAIQSLSGWLAPSFNGVSVMALDCILARLYANHAKVDISFRDLAKSFGASHMTYKRAFDKISLRMRELENRAIEILTPYFERTGLIESEEVGA